IVPPPPSPADVTSRLSGAAIGGPSGGEHSLNGPFYGVGSSSIWNGDASRIG
ncbi:hypothetical protein PCANC_27341, partial [Puccinia coronata f. sp. avenae]